MLKNEYKIVTRAGKTPSREHEQRFNTPAVLDVAIVIVRGNFESRDIIITKTKQRFAKNFGNMQIKRCSSISIDILGRRRWLPF